MYLSRTTHGDSIRTFNAGRFVLYQSTYAPGTSLPQHYHENPAMMFATRGRFSEQVAGRTFDCAAFDVIARPAGEVHTNRYNGGATSCIIANFPGDLARFFSAPSMLPRVAVAPIANRVAREIEVGDEVSPLVVEGLLLELIGAASRPVTCKFPPSWLPAASEFIHEHAAEKVTLHEIAAAARVHPASVVRAFRAHLQCTPGDYLRGIRVEAAKRELMETTRSVGEIALDAGFYDQSHFTNAFRRATGMTPREFRNAFRVQN